MTSRTLDLSISRKNIEDQIAALLYATGHIQDNEDVVSIKVNGETVGKGLQSRVWVDQDCVSLQVEVSKRQEVSVRKE